MKKFIVSIIILISFPASLFSHVDHYQDFNQLEYELFRNNKLIGFHRYDFLRKNDFLTVKSLVNFKITKLGVELYKYSAESEEIYKNSKFLSFASKTNQNKKLKYVNIKLEDQKKELLIEGSSYKGPASLDSIVGTWWNHEIVKAKSQISAISGRIIKQKVTFIGKEQIKIGNKTYNTLHFNFASSDASLPEKKKLNTDIWYDEKTFLWLKASSDKSGHWEYRLKSFN